MTDALYVDAPSLLYRAFFALPTSMTDKGGRPVNAARGFSDMLARLLTDRRPDEVVAVFDADWRPAWRVELYSGYKSDRVDDPPELAGQMGLVRDFLDAAGIDSADARGFEADDVLATLVESKPPDRRAGVVTGDRDLVALVRDPDVKLLYAARGIGRLEELDEAAVLERYGVPPRMYEDFAVLRGDPSDGLPGVPGIGPVRAAALLREFGSLAAVLANLERLPPRRRAAFERSRPYLEAAKQVVRLARDVDVRLRRSRGPDPDRLRALGSEHNLGGAATRLAGAVEARQ